MKKYLPMLLTASLAVFSSTSFATNMSPVRVNADNVLEGYIPVFSGKDTITRSGITASSLSGALESVDKLQSESNSNNRSISDLNDKISKLESNNTALEQRINQLQKSIEDMQSSNNSLSRQINDLASKIK